MKLDADEFTALVGDRNRAMRIMEVWHGHRIPRLTPARVSREALYAAIRASLAEHLTYAEAAEKHHVSRYTVWRAVNWHHGLRKLT